MRETVEVIHSFKQVWESDLCKYLGDTLCNAHEVWRIIAYFNTENVSKDLITILYITHSYSEILEGL